MTAEQSVLVFGVLTVVVFVALLSLGGKKKADNGKQLKAGPASAPGHGKPVNRAQRRKAR